MKRLIYIFLFLPLLLNGQILEQKTYPFQNYCFNFSSNYINTGDSVQGQTPFNFKTKLKVNSYINYQGIFNCNHGGANLEGIYIRVTKTTGEIYINIKDSTSFVGFSTGIILKIDTLYNIELDWDGVIGTNNMMLVVNKDTSYYSVTKEWSGNSAYTLEVGKLLTSGYWFDGKIYYYSYTINGNPEKIVPLSEGYSDTIYEVTTRTKYIINNIVTQSQWVEQTDYQYNEDYGLTKVKYNGNSIFVPYTTGKIPIYDHSSPVMNAAEKYINYPSTLWGKNYWVK